MLTLNSLPKSHGKTKKRLGRGNSSSGNYSGRGMKGQRSRSGGKSGLKLRGLKQTILHLPKSRGFKSGAQRAQVVNLQDLESRFAAGDTVNAQALLERKLIASAAKPVKVLGNGELTKKLTVELNAASASAAKAIADAGGTFVVATAAPAAPAKTTAKAPADAK